MQNLRRCLTCLSKGGRTISIPHSSSVGGADARSTRGLTSVSFRATSPCDGDTWNLTRFKSTYSTLSLGPSLTRRWSVRSLHSAVGNDKTQYYLVPDTLSSAQKRSLSRCRVGNCGNAPPIQTASSPLLSLSNPMRLNSVIDEKTKDSRGAGISRAFGVWRGNWTREDDGRPETASGRKAAKGRKSVRTPFSSIVKLGLRGSKKRTPVDVDQDFTENVHITTLRAITDYLIRPEDLEGLPTIQRRSPFEGSSEITVYLRSDVEKRAIEIWGSPEILEAQQRKKVKEDEAYKTRIYEMKRVLREYRNKSFNSGTSPEERAADADPIVDLKIKEKNENENMWSSGTGRVVAYAVGINTLNTLGKFLAWFFTGSHAMFSEAIHSLADTTNQVVLGVGLYQSGKQPDLEHPYGYVNMRYISCLISGCGIFFVGAGLSCYHGINGLLNPPEQLESFFWAYVVLGATLLSESVTLVMSVNEIKRAALEKKMSVWEYVKDSVDPSVNVVLLEDLAAVLGVAIAVSSMAITSLTNNPMWDSLGCCGVGVLLGGVASFIVYSNTVVLVGKSISEDKKAEISTKLENDRLIRALHDVKATDMGNDTIRFKAEVDFDGRELTRTYLDKQDVDEMMAEMQMVQKPEDAEAFMLKHGENIVDSLGAEVDRIEKKLRQAHPELRHVDLEVL